MDELNLNRRGFIGGLLASAAIPTINPIVGINAIADYVPSMEYLNTLDILYGQKYIKILWSEDELRIENISPFDVYIK